MKKSLFTPSGIFSDGGKFTWGSGISVSFFFVAWPQSRSSTTAKGYPLFLTVENFKELKGRENKRQLLAMLPTFTQHERDLDNDIEHLKIAVTNEILKYIFRDFIK